MVLVAGVGRARVLPRRLLGAPRDEETNTRPHEQDQEQAADELRRGERPAEVEPEHDADLEDDKFHRVECVGIDRILKGCAKQDLPDEEILRRGFECFDALYSFMQRR